MQTKHKVSSHPNGGRTDMMLTHPVDAFPVFRVEADPQHLVTMRNAEARQALFV